MTQAPTPGPLSGDDVKPGHVYVEVSGLTGTGKSAVMGEIEIALKALSLTVEHGTDFQAEKNGTHADWQEALDLYKPVVVLRERNVSRLTLAPTAPVEASGSEREHGPKCWGKTSLSDEMAHCYCGSTALRPQPSGETREQLAAIMQRNIITNEDGGFSFHDLKAADEILALLSTSPLALGGQK